MNIIKILERLMISYIAIGIMLLTIFKSYKFEYNKNLTVKQYLKNKYFYIMVVAMPVITILIKNQQLQMIVFVGVYLSLYALLIKNINNSDKQKKI